MLTFGIFHALYSSTGVEIQKQDPFAHPVERILKFRTSRSGRHTKKSDDQGPCLAGAIIGTFVIRITSELCK